MHKKLKFTVIHLVFLNLHLNLFSFVTLLYSDEVLHKIHKSDSFRFSYKCDLFLCFWWHMPKIKKILPIKLNDKNQKTSFTTICLWNIRKYPESFEKADHSYYPKAELLSRLLLKNNKEQQTEVYKMSW